MSEPFISHSEITGTIYIVCGTKKYNVTEQVIKAMRETGRLEQERPRGEWEWKSPTPKTIMTPHCSNCGHMNDFLMETNFCPNCGASMSANDRQVTGKLNSEIEYKAKVKELEEAIARCEQAEKEFKNRTCKFRSPINCDFCAFHSDCEEHWEEGEAE